MRIAVFLDNINYKELDDKLKTVILFDVDNTVITAAGRFLLHIYNLNYLTIWLSGKKVETVYIENTDKTFEQCMKLIGIRVEQLSTIKENPILQSLKLPIE